MPKISFLITDDDNKKLDAIQLRYKLGKSDQVRRGIRMLHDYLINDVAQPTTSFEPKKKKVEGK